jgi:hypothetical protein
MIKNIGIITWLLAGLLIAPGIITGCGTVKETTLDSTTAQDIFTRAKTAINEIKTYEYTSTASYQIKDNPQNDTITYHQNNKATYDISNRTAAIGMDSEEKSGSYEYVYFIDGKCYVPNGNSSSEPNGWRQFTDKQEADQIYAMLNEVWMQTGVIDKATVISIKTVSLKGSACYLIEVNPDISSLLDYTEWKRMRSGGDYQQLHDNTKNITVQYWVTQDNLALLKAHIHFETATDSKPSFYSFDITVTFDKVNKPVDFSFPAEITGK